MVLGETGSGKSLMAQALMGTLPPKLDAKGRVAIGDRVLNVGSPARFSGLWGREIGVLPQQPWLSLDPLMRAREQVAETHVLVRGLPRGEARAQAVADLAALGLSGAEARYSAPTGPNAPRTIWIRSRLAGTGHQKQKLVY